MLWPDQVGNSSCRVGEAGTIAVDPGGGKADMLQRSMTMGKQHQGPRSVRTWSRSSAVHNGVSESALVRFTQSSSRQLRQHGVRGTQPSA